jgi:hypothetical protein
MGDEPYPRLQHVRWHPHEDQHHRRRARRLQRDGQEVLLHQKIHNIVAGRFYLQLVFFRLTGNRSLVKWLRIYSKPTDQGKLHAPRQSPLSPQKIIIISCK